MTKRKTRAMVRRRMKLHPNLIHRIKGMLAQQTKGEKWNPSPTAETIAQTIRNSAPTMAAMLEKEGVLLEWAELAHDQVLELKDRNRKAGMTPGEAEEQARKEILPVTPEQEQEWVKANSQPTPQDAKATD